MNFSQSELKSKMIEAKFQEEKLRLQQKHDDTVQKVGHYFILKSTLLHFWTRAIFLL